MDDKRAAKYGRAGVLVIGNDCPLARATVAKRPKETATQLMAAVSPAPRSGGNLQATEMKRQAAAATPAQSRSASSTPMQPLEGPHGVEVPEDNLPFPPPKRMRTAVVKEYTSTQIILDGKVIKSEEKCTEYLTQIEVDEAGMPINGTKHL